MSQQEVIEFLENQEEPLTRGEIAILMGEEASKISRILSKLLGCNEIKYIEINRFKAMERCGAKRRIKLYYL